MALVQLMPVRRRPGVALALKPPPPKNLLKFNVGPIVIEQRTTGDLLIYTEKKMAVTTRVAECDVLVQRMVASETNRILIKNEDVLDLVVALDKVLGNRH